MGANSSRNSDTKTRTKSRSIPGLPCRFCAGVLQNVKVTEAGDLCTRCGGLVRGPKQRHDVKGSQSYDSKEDELPRSILSRMHILPFKETLPVEEDKDTSEDALLKNYVLPYFYEKKPFVKAGERFQIQSIDFRVISCHPPEGVVTQETKIRAFGSPLSVDNKIAKLHCLPVQASLPDWKADSKKYTEEVLFNNYIKPYFASEEPRHIVEGDTFMSQGIQFKIIACEPKDGEVVRETKVFNNGPPIPDIAKIHILPIYETLPNHHKELSEEKLFELYLFPYFSGRFQYCGKGDEIDIDGVDFKVVDIEPEGASGLITNITKMYANGPFIRYSDIKQQQLAADEELARSLQRQEAVFPAQAVAVRMRLEELLRRLPQDDQRRPTIVHINQSLALLPFMTEQMLGRNGGMPGLMALGGDPSNAAASQSDIESLPTRTYHVKKKGVDGKNNEDEYNTCHVCLMDYEEGEELRTLPCFHAYHKACIDKWLQTNRKCPICKNPITSN